MSEDDDTGTSSVAERLYLWGRLLVLLIAILGPCHRKISGLVASLIMARSKMEAVEVSDGDFIVRQGLDEDLSAAPP
jgi:hypothetical protein